MCKFLKPANCRHIPRKAYPCPQSFHTSTYKANPHQPTQGAPDPRLEQLGTVIDDEYAVIRENYETPRHAIVLAHGLLGFDELRLAGPKFPGVQYWRGIKEALSMNGIDVITATVPPSGSIEARAEELAKVIATDARGKAVNIIAGLDSRYMISHLRPKDFKVLSLTTIATPHRGSAVADYLLQQIGDERLAQLYYALEQMKVETGAFSQLTREYMETTFNPITPDAENVRYFSYGATMQPSFWSVFHMSHKYLQQVEGYNDGLVSVTSSRWGTYKGTLLNVSHLDLINWTNRLKWLAGEITGNRRRSVIIEIYLREYMLAKEGL
ncbi:triacylglycerol lipase [Aspergillus avenaceus]|uniref:Triacylglycerol lipase n=1 Tax=Aspergillus avenaceus TaxID=36643 RepID=A0A5N6TK51_ASPAV|nr:triacylglycerol lipase [Aspergillus avenaceus]